MDPENHNESPPSKYPSLSNVGWVLLLSGIPYFAVGFLFQITLAKWPLLLGELALLLPAFIFLRHRRYNVRAVLRLNPVSWRVVAVSVAVGLAITALAMELDRIVNLLLPFPEHLERLLKETLIAESTSDWIILLLATVFFAGAFEEMLFRGFVQNAFEQKHGPMFAIFSTAFLFGAVHLSPWWFIQLIFIAMFLGVLAWRSESIIPSAIVHAQNNGISVLLNNFGEEGLGTWFDWNGHVHPLLLLLALAVLAVGLYLFFRFCEEDTTIPTFLNTSTT